MIILCYSFIYHITCYSFTLYHCIIPLNSNALYANFWIVDYNVSGTTVRNGSTVKFILPSFHFTEWLVCFNNLQSYCTNYLKRCYPYYRELIKVHRSLMSQRIFTASSISPPSKENSIMVMFSASLLHKNESGSGIIVCTHWYMCKDIIIFLYELICEKVIYIYILAHAQIWDFIPACSIMRSYAGAGTVWENVHLIVGCASIERSIQCVTAISSALYLYRYVAIPFPL